MKNDKFKIIIMAKDFLFDLDNILCRFPNKEKVLRDKFKTCIYEIIELIYEANYLMLNKYKEQRIRLQLQIMSKISILDLLLEESYRKGYITENIFKNKSKQLSDLFVKIKGWIAYEKNNSKGNFRIL